MSLLYGENNMVNIKNLILLFFVVCSCAGPRFIILDYVPKATNSYDMTKIDTIKTPDGNMYKIWIK
jgi:hypothetical protein